jgi:hypothetical protein
MKRSAPKIADQPHGQSNTRPQSERRRARLAVLSFELVLSFLRKRLTYANVMATIALCVSLGGVSYATIALPPNSVGSTQLRAGAVGLSALRFPLSTVGITDSKVHDLTKNGCNGGGFAGNAAPDCTPANPNRGAPTPGREVRIVFRTSGRLLVFATATLKDEGAPQTTASVTLKLNVDLHPVTESQVTIAGGQTLQVPIQALANASAGSHTAGLEVSAEYHSSGPGDVLVSGASVIASALPA